MVYQTNRIDSENIKGKITQTFFYANLKILGIVIIIDIDFFYVPHPFTNKLRLSTASYLVYLLVVFLSFAKVPASCSDIISQACCFTLSLLHSICRMRVTFSNFPWKHNEEIMITNDPSVTICFKNSLLLTHMKSSLSFYRTSISHGSRFDFIRAEIDQYLQPYKRMDILHF